MNITIRNKMILSYMIIALIPFLLFVAISMGMFVRREEQNVTEHTNQMLEQVKTSLEVYISSVEKFCNFLIIETREDNFLTLSSEEHILFRQDKAAVQQLFREFMDTHEEVAGILIATEQDLVVASGMTRVSRDSFLEEEWYRKACEQPDELQIISNVLGRNIVTDESYSVDDVFSLSKCITDAQTGQILGVILMDIRHDIIRQSAQGITIGERGFIYVMDSESNIVYTPDNEVVYRVNPEWIVQAAGGPVTKKIQDENYQIRNLSSAYTGWNIIGVFSMDEITRSMRMMNYILISCLIIMAVFIIYVSLKLSLTITKPIVRLKESMEVAESGDLQVRFTPQYHDEVGELGESFNHMIVQMEELLHMVYVEQKNKRNAELKVLQEQIKPHFLYNTLDTISWMAREYEAEDIVRIIDALTSMFRIGLSSGRDYITVQKEIEYVSNYLHIQKIRYGSKLSYRIRDEEDVWEYMIPKLILQPLVENAIYHGIKNTGREGTILVTAERQGTDYMMLSVADDGAGMEPEKLEELNRQMNERSELNESQSFGLFYVKERLRLRYGDDFEVRVKSRPGEGTVVRIRIPLTWKEGQDAQYRES